MPSTDIAIKSAKAEKKPAKIFDERGLFLLITRPEDFKLLVALVG